MDRGAAFFRFFLRIYQWVTQRAPVLTYESRPLNLAPLNLAPLNLPLVSLRPVDFLPTRASIDALIAPSLELALNEADSNEFKLRDCLDLEIPYDFKCTISHEIMTNPVYDPAFPQKKYDLLVIRAWLKDNNTNPYTRTPLCMDDLVYDEVLKVQIDDFVNDTLTQAPTMLSRSH